jgi:sporulation protein YlmC with PRC-barrel domain
MNVPLAYSIAEACAVARAGRTAIYEAIRDGALTARKRVGKTLYYSAAGTKVPPHHCFLEQWRNIMIFKYLAIALLATASVTGAASAQTATNQVDSTTTATTHKEGEWRASKLTGVDVYNEANEKIGDINEVILDRSGKVANVILGVGGVLGLGEHYVAVAFDKLKWVDQPVTSTTASTTSAPANAPATSPPPEGTTRTTTTGAVTTTTTTTTTSASKRWYPDHAVYNATKDELKAMPEFKY